MPSKKASSKKRKPCKKSQKRSRSTGRCVRRSCKSGKTRDLVSKRCRSKKRRGAKKGSLPQIDVAKCLSNYKWTSIKRYAKMYGVDVNDKSDRKICHEIARKMIKEDSVPAPIIKSILKSPGSKGSGQRVSFKGEEGKRGQRLGEEWRGKHIKF